MKRLPQKKKTEASHRHRRSISVTRRSKFDPVRRWGREGPSPTAIVRNSRSQTCVETPVSSQQQLLRRLQGRRDNGGEAPLSVSGWRGACAAMKVPAKSRCAGGRAFAGSWRRSRFFFGAASTFHFFFTERELQRQYFIRDWCVFFARTTPLPARPCDHTPPEHRFHALTRPPPPVLLAAHDLASRTRARQLQAAWRLCAARDGWRVSAAA